MKKILSAAKCSTFCFQRLEREAIWLLASRRHAPIAPFLTNGNAPELARAPARSYNQANEAK